MPDDSDRSGLSETARVALPILVRLSANATPMSDVSRKRHDHKIARRAREGPEVDLGLDVEVLEEPALTTEKDEDQLPADEPESDSQNQELERAEFAIAQRSEDTGLEASADQPGDYQGYGRGRDQRQPGLDV